MKKLSSYYEDLVLNPEPNGFCLLEPGFTQYKDEFEKLLSLNGWKILNQCIKKFTRPEIEQFYITHKDEPFYQTLCDYMITEECLCYMCYKNCKDPYKDMKDFKDKIREEWGIDEMKNAMHSSDCHKNLLSETKIAFSNINS
jgi:nucleoside diphosphate kinase